MTIVKEILQQMPAVGKPQAKFLETLFATILALRGRVNFRNRRCRKGVDLMLDCDPKLGAIDEETNDQIVHRRRFGKANRAAHETLDPGPAREGCPVVRLTSTCRPNGASSMTW